MVLEKNARATSRAIYESYREWCFNNSIEAEGMNKFFRQLNDHAQRLELIPSHNLTLPNGRTARGFIGIRVL